MLKNRILPCLDIKDGRTVKGINFQNIVDVGNPVELAKLYAEQGADELVFLDITATVEKRKTLINLVNQISKEINIPFTVGGGVSSVQDVSNLIKAGADKVSVNSSALKRPELIQKIAQEFGSQCLVVAIDTKYEDDIWKVYINGGRTATSYDTITWVKEVASLGAGEILLTSMNNDGTKNGFALDITQQVSQCINIPVIASGGAGSMQHFREVFKLTGATGGLAASVFHSQQIPIPDLKDYLKTNKISIR